MISDLSFTVFVLHLEASRESVPIGAVALPTVLFLTGIVSLAIVGLGIAALAQRRSRSYLLIALALTTLLGRTVVGGFAMDSTIPMQLHHLFEHALDGVMAVLLLAAVYCARTTERPQVEASHERDS